VNDDGKRVPLDVNAGDRILFGKYAGQEIKLDGKEYTRMTGHSLPALDTPRVALPIVKSLRALGLSQVLHPRDAEGLREGPPPDRALPLSLLRTHAGRR
jgi:hypothetical protein